MTLTHRSYRIHGKLNVCCIPWLVRILLRYIACLPNTATLRDLIKKDAVFAWTSSHDKAFESTKKLICREVTLAYFKPGADTVIQVDASGRGLGAVRHVTRTLSERCSLLSLGASDFTPTSMGRGSLSNPTICR